MTPNTLKTLLEAGEPAVGLWLSSPDPFIAELLGTLEPAYLNLDLQHGLIGYENVPPILQALSRSNTTPLVRVPWNEPGIIGKVLDAGALGVIIPMVNSVAEAEAAVASCFYQPKGSRSHGPIRAAVTHGSDYGAVANDHVMCIPMIETVAAIEALDDILAVPGIDAIYVGPADLSRTLGLPPGNNDGTAAFDDALATIVDACARAGIPAGIHASPPLVAKRLEMGFGMVTATSDTLALMAGARAALAGTGGEGLY